MQKHLHLKVLASAQDISNYKRVWARDGVICGLAALASGEEAHEKRTKTPTTLYVGDGPVKQRNLN
jgi:hypothetical protein